MPSSGQALTCLALIRSLFTLIDLRHLDFVALEGLVWWVWFDRFGLVGLVSLVVRVSLGC